MSVRECSALLRSSGGIWTQALRATLKKCDYQASHSISQGHSQICFLVTCESYRKTWMAVKTGYRNRRMAVKQVTKARNMKRFYFYFWLLSSFFLFFFPENILQPIRPPVKLTDCWTFFHQKLFFVSSFLLKSVHSLTPTLANDSLMFKIDSVTIWLVMKPVSAIRTRKEYLNFLNSFYCKCF